VLIESHLTGNWEKDDYKTQLCTAKKQLQEASEHHNRSENKISKIQQTLRAVQEDKANAEAKLTQKTNTLVNVEETLKKKVRRSQCIARPMQQFRIAIGIGQ